MQLTEHFYKYEFESKDGSEMPDFVLENIQELAYTLQEIRYALLSETGESHPIIITSGYRSPYYNDVVLHSRGIKTSKDSQHKLGKAADIVVRDMSPTKVAKVVSKLRKKGCIPEGGLGLYNGFVHIDNRGYNVKWDKSSWFNFLPF